MEYLVWFGLDNWSFFDKDEEKGTLGLTDEWITWLELDTEFWMINIAGMETTFVAAASRPLSADAGTDQSWRDRHGWREASRILP